MLAIAFVPGAAVISHVYHHHLSPLARLKNSIEVGDPYASLEPRFNQFHHTYADSTLSRDRTVHHLLKGPVPAAQQLFVYRDSALGEAYLQVLFDRDLRVSEVSYLID